MRRADSMWTPSIRATPVFKISLISLTGAISTSVVPVSEAIGTQNGDAPEDQPGVQMSARSPARRPTLLSLAGDFAQPDRSRGNDRGGFSAPISERCVPTLTFDAATTRRVPMHIPTPAAAGSALKRSFCPTRTAASSLIPTARRCPCALLNLPSHTFTGRRAAS